MNLGAAMAERGLLPDAIVRTAIRRLIEARAKELERQGPQPTDRFIETLHDSPIALAPERANAQHYELPTAFFEEVLGPRLKYSCAFYPGEIAALAEAEECMLDMTCERARLADGMRILELGCGWGSLTLWMAERYPHAEILAVSNSSAQRAFITSKAADLGLRNVEVTTADMNTFAPEGAFDRVVSVEMFEHMRNYGALLARIRGWLRPGGCVFLHFFCHKEACYPYVVEGEGSWMARHFFTGGMMPSYSLLNHFQEDLAVEQRWAVNGLQYARTCDDWLAQHDAARAKLLPIFEQTYGSAKAPLWFRRWRLFFMACAELFRCRGGKEWFVGHYLLKPRGEA